MKPTPTPSLINTDTKNNDKKSPVTDFSYTPHLPYGPVNPPSTLPPDFWKPIPPSNRPDPDLMTQLSDVITGKLGREQISKLVAPTAAWLAGKFGSKKTAKEIEKDLNEAIINGGVEGFKKALEAGVNKAAGEPTDTSDYYGPNKPKDLNEKIFKGPEIPF